MDETSWSYQHTLYAQTYEYLVVIKHHQGRAGRYDLTRSVVQKIVREAVALTLDFRSPFARQVDLRHVIVRNKIVGEAE